MAALTDCTPEELGKLGAASGWLISTWADAVDRIARAGADAIEIHIAHGYILGVFLNRRDN